MNDILSEIIANKQVEIAMQKQAVSREHLMEQVEAILQEDASPRRSMKLSLIHIFQEVPLHHFQQGLSAPPDAARRAERHAFRQDVEQENHHLSERK